MADTKMAQWETFTLPRWDALPNIDLYLDQVLALVHDYLSEIMPQDQKKYLTNSMINNYVKQDLMPAPVKKRYSRQHLAFLMVITLMKQTFSLSEIRSVLDTALKETSIKDFYNDFCEQQEAALRYVKRFDQDDASAETQTATDKMNKLITMAVSMSLYSKQRLNEQTSAQPSE